MPSPGSPWLYTAEKVKGSDEGTVELVEFEMVEFEMVEFEMVEFEMLYIVINRKALTESRKKREREVTCFLHKITQHTFAPIDLAPFTSILIRLNQCTNKSLFPSKQHGCDASTLDNSEEALPNTRHVGKNKSTHTQVGFLLERCRVFVSCLQPHRQQPLRPRKSAAIPAPMTKASSRA